MDRETARMWTVGIVVALLLFVAVCGTAWAWPQYNIYKQTASGEAQLKEAQYTRQISELDAQAKINIAKGEAQAEIERAKGAAKANEILSDSLTGKEDYLRYLYIQALANGNNREIIYIPTNGLLPITESMRLQQPAAPAPPAK